MSTYQDEDGGRTRTIYPGEGVIKFKQDFTEEVVFIPEDIRAVNALRKTMYGLGLIGVYPRDHPEFAGIGFGNASQRVGKGTGFMITGSSTGNQPSLGPVHYTLVEHYDIRGNYVMARGGTPASSESLTHAAVYDAVPEAKFVAHGHHPELWDRREELGFHTTSPDAEYGTPEMADEITRIIRESSVEENTFLAMGGHTDGLICWGRDVDSLAAYLEKILKTQ